MVAAHNVRIVVANSYEISRQALAALISQQPGYSVIASVGYGLEFVEEVRRSKPDIVLMENNAPDSTWVAGLHSISQLGFL